MKKLQLILTVLISSLVFSQKAEKKSNETVLAKIESNSPQDFSVPPPPITVFPAQFPGGNKELIKQINLYFSDDVKKSISGSLKTQIIIKIDREGNVINISTFGSNDDFNKIVSQAVFNITENIKWKAGQNKQGENVIDLVRLPFSLKR